jgi:hypothetical protein
MRFAGRNVVDRLVQGVEERLAAAAAASAALAGMFAGPAPAKAGAAGAASGGRAAGGGGSGKHGPYVIQVGDRPIVELVIDTVTGNPEVVASSADEGSRRRTFQSSARSRR